MQNLFIAISSAILTITSASVLASFTNRYYRGSKHLKRKKKCGGNLCLVQQGLNCSLLQNCLELLELNISGLYDQTPIGKYTHECYYQVIRQSSVIIVFVTEELLKDRCIHYILSLILQRHSCLVVMAFESELQIPTKFDYLKYISNCNSLEFSVNSKGQLINAENFASHIKEILYQRQLFTSGSSRILKNVKWDENPIFEYDIFLVHDDNSPGLQWKEKMQNQYKLSIYDPGRDMILGQYKHLDIYESIRKSRTVVFYLSNELIYSSLLEYTVQLALLKGHNSVFIIIKDTGKVLVPFEKIPPTMQTALITCKKIYIK